MRRSLKSLSLGLALGAVAPSAIAAETSECELLLVQIIQSPDGKGEAQVPTYVPAEEFMATLGDDKPGHMADYLGHKIQAIMCRRNDIIPSEEDYAIISTGIPFILSQDFDSKDTDSLTLYWKDETVQHVYKGYPLSEEAEAILETRLADFSKQGIVGSTEMTVKTEAETETETSIKKSEDTISESEIVILPANPQANPQMETEDALEFEPLIEIESTIESEK